MWENRTEPPRDGAAGQEPKARYDMLLTEAGFKVRIIESRGTSSLPEDGDEK